MVRCLADEVHHEGDTETAVKELENILELGNVNIYMFEGGTNFSFMNGSNYSDHLTADVTSYDYDALLTEDGQITDKYRRFRKVISRFNKEEPLIREKEPSSERVAYGSCTVAQKVDLFHALDCLSEPVKTVSPKSMEQLGQGYGYMLYSSVLHTERELRSLRLYKAADRAIAFADGKRVLTAMDRELLERHEIELQAAGNIRLDILMENMGRVNYGPMINWQRKGIDGCVMINDRFVQHGWLQYSLPLDNLDKLDYTRGYEKGMPAFYRFVFTVKKSEILFWTAKAGERAVLLLMVFIWEDSGKLARRSGCICRERF